MVAGTRKRAFRGSAVGIFPSPAFPLLSKGPTARDDGGVATPTARTGNGSARRAYAPARRISRASGAGTCWSRGRRLTFKLGSAWDEKAPRGCFLCRSATRWARVEACGYASSGRFGRPNEQIRGKVERHGPSSRPRGLRRALRLGTEMGYRKQLSFYRNDLERDARICNMYEQIDWKY